MAAKHYMRLNVTMAGFGGELWFGILHDLELRVAVPF